jgi:hypothetical protein
MIDVIKLARQAGIDVLEVESERASMWPATPEGLAKFAELVLEEAAKTCDESAWTHPNAAMLGPEQNSLKCAAAIRAMKPNTNLKDDQ